MVLDLENIYIDKTGAIIENPTAIIEQETFKEGLAPAKDGDKYGYINRDGEFIIKPSFFIAEPFCEGLARVKTGPTSKWGYINTTGSYAFKAKFFDAKDFCDGIARVLVKMDAE